MPQLQPPSKRKYNTRHLIQGTRFDATDSAFLARELESIDERYFTELLPGLDGLRFIPLIQNVSPDSNAYTYSMWKFKGRVKAGSRNADDAPRATAVREEASRVMKELEGSYAWTISEIRRAQRLGIPLDQATVDAARRVMGQKIETMLATGDSTLGIEGLLNLTGVDSETISTKTSGNTWEANAATDPAKIIGDVNLVTAEVFKDLKGTQAQFDKWLVLVSPAAYAAIATTPRSTTSDTTILQFLLKNNPWLESIEPWSQCTGAGSGGTDRLVAFPRNESWGGALVPEEFEALDPQPRNLEIVVPTRGVCGGVITRYAVAARYMDGI